MNVTTHHNDNARTGANLVETQLTVANVAGGRFGRLFERKVDGATYAQPLYVAGVNVRGVGVRNVLYVATMRNWVYAFDADDPSASAPLWKVSLGSPIHLPDAQIGPQGYADMEWEVGILSTPVISKEGNAIYVLATSKEGRGYRHRIHKLNLTSGSALVTSVVIDGAPNTATFTGLVNKVTLGDTSPVTPALASLEGRLYIAWKGDGNDNLNVMVSTDNGRTFGHKHTSSETSPHTPALCAHNGVIYISWKGDGNDHLNIALVQTVGNTITGLVNKVTLGDTSPITPALASLEGRLYISWKGDGNDNLNVMASTDNGRSFGSKCTSSETSPRSPALCAHNGGIYVGWKGDSNDNLNIAQTGNLFQSERQNQRAGLALGGGVVYAAFASYGDRGPYHGWVFGFDADTLRVHSSVFVSTPGDGNGMGGIWQAGEAPAVDAAGNLYFMVGNGTFRPGSDFGDCFVKLTPDLLVASWFSPFNNASLNSGDTDLGSAGVMLLPATNRVLGGGKEGKFYLLDANNLGGFNPSGDTQIPLSFYVNRNHHIHGSPVIWAGPMGTWIYVWPEVDTLRAYAFSDNTFVRNGAGQVVPASMGITGDTPGMPGGFLSISANGSVAGTGIVWANHPWAIDTNQRIGEGVLRAYDASNLGRELWNSRQNRGRDDFGNFAKFCPPTVANGRVYVSSMGGLQRKVTLGNETTRAGVSLVSLNDNTVLLAWTGTDSPGHLNVRRSGNAIDWPDQAKVRLGETSPQAPALAAADGRAFLAWLGNDVPGHLNLLSSTDGVQWGNNVTLGETSSYGPALACGNGKIFMAWTGTDNSRHLNVIRSDDGGRTFQRGNKVTLGETSGDGPALAFWNGTLYLLWCGTDSNHSLNIMESTDGIHWRTKVTFADSSDSRPAMAVDGNTPILCWRGRSNDLLNQMTVRGPSVSNFSDKRTFYDTAADGPRLCVFRGDAYVAWAGTDNPSHINVAQVSLGGVSAYGLF